MTFLISAAFKGVALITGRSLFQCGYTKVRFILEGGAYLRPGAYLRKYGKWSFQRTSNKEVHHTSCRIKSPWLKGWEEYKESIANGISVSIVKWIVTINIVQKKAISKLSTNALCINTFKKIWWVFGGLIQRFKWD